MLVNGAGAPHDYIREDSILLNNCLSSFIRPAKVRHGPIVGNEMGQKSAPPYLIHYMQEDDILRVWRWHESLGMAGASSGQHGMASITNGGGDSTTKKTAPPSFSSTPGNALSNTTSGVASSLLAELPFALSECRYLYLDVGSNIGVQVRKFFEPEQYPESPILPLYNEVFGFDIEERRRLGCAIGVEPNPESHIVLNKIETAYRKVGWRAHFLLAGVWDESIAEGLRFSCPKGISAQHHCWGGRMLPPGARPREGEVVQHIPVLSLAELVAEVEARRGPREVDDHAGGEAFIRLMKLDVEGAEYTSGFFGHDSGPSTPRVSRQ